MSGKNLTISYINKRIENEICYKTLEQLSDLYLINEYIKCKSFHNKNKKLSNILDKYVDENTKQNILNDYLLDLIPPGTKGVIRGNKFNNIVKEFIINLSLDINRFQICFEKKCEINITTEIPDWYILEISSNKLLIGMNQLDLWKGGQQINRGFKYLYNNHHNTQNSKLVCVIANNIKFKNKNKAFKLFEIGFKNNTLCYLNNLKNIIDLFFN